MTSYIKKIKIEGISGSFDNDLNIDEFEFTNINNYNNNDRINIINITTNLDTQLVEYTNDILPIIYNGFSYYNKNIENITNMTDWIKIKHKPLNNTSFYYGNTFEGSVINDNISTGDRNNNNNEWAIPFDDSKVKFYLFIIHDSNINSNYKDRWIVFDKYEMKKTSTYSTHTTYNYHSNYPHAYKTTNNLNGFNEKTSTHFNGPNYDQIIYNRNYGTHNGTAYPDPQIPLYFIKNDKTYETNTTVLTNDLGYNTNMIYSQIYGTLGNAEAGVYVKYTDDLPKKILSSSYSSIIKREFENYNIFGFYYNSNLELIYDFTLFNSFNSWISYANSIGSKTNFNTFSQGGLFLHSDYGYIELLLHLDYNFVSVYYGNPHASGTTNLYIDDVYKEGCSSNQFKTYTTTYTPGQILKIKEVNGIVSSNLVIKFSNTNNTKYSITFPNETDCDVLIIGGGGSGGVRDAGSGGAGGLIYLNNVKISSANLTIGKGGVAVSGPGNVSGNKGENTIIDIMDNYGNTVNYTAEGGGKGGEWGANNNNSTGNGGSGGGGGGNNSVGGIGNQSTSESGGYGNNGAQGRAGQGGGGGGGGGAGGLGTRQSGNTGGNGGPGMNFSHIFGTQYGVSGWFAGGGGSGYGSGSQGFGGIGGGGNGVNGGTADSGIDGTGGGGGGGRSSSDTSGKGGDGIILIKYNKKELYYNEIKKIDYQPINLKKLIDGDSETDSKYYEFTHNGSNNTHTNYTFELTSSAYCEILVAGGGGGGGEYGGGGGGGDIIYFNDLMLEKGIYNIYVGNGGNGGGPNLTYEAGHNGHYSKLYLNNNYYITAGGGGGGNSSGESSDNIIQYTYKINDIIYNSQGGGGGSSALSNIHDDNRHLGTVSLYSGNGGGIMTYLIERMYPPIRNLTSSSHTISNEDYGNGLYETSQSESYDSISDGYSAFNTSMDSGPHFNAKYTNGIYNGSDFLVSDYIGDWITIKMPIDIKLTKYGFKQRTLTYNNRAPGIYKIYGSNNGTNWTELVNKTTTITYSNDNFEESVITSQTYNYFGLVVNKLLGLDSFLNFDEWYIYGQEYDDTRNNYGGGGGGGFFYSVLDCDIINLKAWYKFDNNILDNIQNNHFSKNSGSYIYENGIINKALNIGAGIYTINSSILSTLLDDNIWSISVWFYRTELTTHCSILSRYDDDDLSPICGFNLYLETGQQKIKLERQEGSENNWIEVWSSDSIQINTWYHIVAISNMTDLKLYINGVLNDEKPTSTYWSTPAFDNIIGVGPFVKSGVILSTTTSGSVEDLRIYNKELTYDEIQKLILNSNGGTRIGNIAGRGGNGLFSSITGEIIGYGGGGGGGTLDKDTLGSNGGNGTSGGGDGGREDGRYATQGIDGRGGGGGGGGGSLQRNGAKGGSGIIIIKTKPKSITILKTNDIITKYIELDLIDNNTSIIDGISSLKWYWNNKKILKNISSERLYPHPNARLTSFKKIDGISPEIYEISGNDYGNGTYTIKFSSQFTDNSYSPHYIFSKGITSPEYDASWGTNYNSGIYIGSEDFAGDNYKGDWITIKMPVKIIPTKIIFSGILYTTGHLNRLPRKYRLYGSNDESNWDIIINDELQSDNTNIIEIYNNINNIAYKKNILSSKAYNHFALVVNKIGNTNVLAMADFDIYGYEIDDTEILYYKYDSNNTNGSNQSEYNLTLDGNTECDILIIGGGGGGGANIGSGGGAGGLLLYKNISLGYGIHVIKVGNGGSGANNDNDRGDNGYNSEFNEYISYGGGGGTGQTYVYNISGTDGGKGGFDGASGGGGTLYKTGPGLGIANQGNNGGNGPGTELHGGGGGGAGEEGQDSSGGGAGGNGLYYKDNINFKKHFKIEAKLSIGELYRNNIWFSGGGAANYEYVGTEKGGYGGGGGGNSINALPNTGGGGAGSYSSGGNGSSGIVIIKIKNKKNIINDNSRSTWKTILYDQYDNNIDLENNIELKEENLIYTTLNNNITAYNYFEYILFSEERLYPPYFVRKYINTSTFLIEKKIYGNGIYTITWSSYLNTTTDSPLNTFIVNKESAMWQQNLYTNNGISLKQVPSRATYNGINYIVSDYKGDWIKISLPYKILLSRFIIAMAYSSSIDSINHTSINNFPHDFKIYGSNDDTNWNLIIHKNITRLDLNDIYNNTNSSFSALNYKIYDNERLTKFEMYSHYALVVNKTGGETTLFISSWDIYGKEKNELLLVRPTNIPFKHNVKFSQLAKVYRSDIEFSNNINVTNIKFSDYYLGNFIPINILNVNVPTSGEISFSDLKDTSSTYLPIPFKDDRTAHYTSDTETLVFDGSTIIQWNDISDNNRNIVTYRGSPHIENFVKNSKNLTGGDVISVIAGDENSGYVMPFALQSNNYTFCYIARYVGDTDTTYNKRIFDSRSGTGQNTCWGFHDNLHKSHNGEKGWHTVENKHISDNNTWLIGVETTNSSRFNGMNCDHTYTDNTTNYPRTVSNGFDPILTINYGHYTSQSNNNYISKWQVAEMIFYNRELTLEEKKEVESYLSTKYSHISFNNVISSLNDYKNLSQTGLYDLWYSIYDGNKYAYSTNGTYYGPYNYLFDIIKSSNYYYAEWNRVNTNGDQDLPGYSNRNVELIYYSIVLPSSDIQYKVNMVALGGGGGGGRANGGGGGAGGQAYVINRTELQNVPISISVGGRGYGGGLWISEQNTSGGDTTITFNGNTMIGYGGLEGRDSTRASVLGGSYSGGDGGSAGGSSLDWGCGGACGAAISTVLKNVTLTSQTFWDVLSAAPIYHPGASWLSWSSVNSGSWGNNPPGAGGAGSRYGRQASDEGESPSWNADPWARNGCWGGGGAAVIIIEF